MMNESGMESSDVWPQQFGDFFGANLALSMKQFCALAFLLQQFPKTRSTKVMMRLMRAVYKVPPPSDLKDLDQQSAIDDPSHQRHRPPEEETCILR